MPTTKARPRRRRRLPPPARRVSRPRHFWANPDASALAEALKRYHARGVPVFLGVPEMEVTGRIVEQRFGGVGAQFLVRLDEPIDRESYAVALDLFPEAVDRIFGQAARFGHLDAAGALRSIWAMFRHVALDVRRAPRGTLTEYQDADPLVYAKAVDFPGKVVGMERGVGPAGEDVVFMELFEPLPMWQLPRRVAFDRLRPGFASKTAYFVRSEVYEGHPRIRELLGPAKKVEGSGDFEMHSLEEPRPVDEVVRLIRSAVPGPHPEGPYRGSMSVFFVLPLWNPETKHGGLFRPMREDLAKGLELEVWEGAEWLEGLT